MQPTEAQVPRIPMRDPRVVHRIYKSDGCSMVRCSLRNRDPWTYAEAAPVNINGLNST